jgi:hypothetical protein
MLLAVAGGALGKMMAAMTGSKWRRHELERALVGAGERSCRPRVMVVRTQNGFSHGTPERGDCFERVTGDRLSGSSHFRYTLFAGDEQWRLYESVGGLTTWRTVDSEAEKGMVSSVFCGRPRGLYRSFKTGGGSVAGRRTAVDASTRMEKLPQTGVSKRILRFFLPRHVRRSPAPRAQ